MVVNHIMWVWSGWQNIELVVNSCLEPLSLGHALAATSHEVQRGRLRAIFSSLLSMKKKSL